MQRARSHPHHQMLRVAEGCSFRSLGGALPSLLRVHYLSILSEDQLRKAILAQFEADH